MLALHSICHNHHTVSSDAYILTHYQLNRACTVNETRRMPTQFRPTLDSRLHDPHAAPASQEDAVNEDAVSCMYCDAEDDSFAPYALGEGLSIIETPNLPSTFFSSAITPREDGWGGLLTAEDLAKLVQFGRMDDVLMIDVRPNLQFAKCHISGALNEPAVSSLPPPRASG